MTGGSVAASRRTPSVSEIQAALQAARGGQFAAAVTDEPGESAQPAPAAVVAPRRRTSVVGPVQPRSHAGAAVTLMSVHGGSGARSLAAVLPCTRYVDREWPTDLAGPVVLVCRSNHRGYTAAQQYARAHRDEAELRGSVELAGVVVVADCPGRAPAPLRRLERLVSGALPILGRVPWMPQWRLGPPDPAAPVPPWVATLSAAVGVVGR